MFVLLLLLLLLLWRSVFVPVLLLLAAAPEVVRSNWLISFSRGDMLTVVTRCCLLLFVVVALATWESNVVSCVLCILWGNCQSECSTMYRKNDDAYERCCSCCCLLLLCRRHTLSPVRIRETRDKRQTRKRIPPSLERSKSKQASKLSVRLTSQSCFEFDQYKESTGSIAPASFARFSVL